MKLTNLELNRFIALTSTSGYNEENKAEYKLLGRKVLRHIVGILGLPKGSFEIRWNAGGIAVSGDHILHHDKFYLALHDDIGMGSFYVRSCNGRKDYTGGMNHNIRWWTLKNNGINWLANYIREKFLQ